jgi:hypothetical protein
MQVFCKNLPIDIQYRILSYTYLPQPKDLLDDIENFYTTRNAIKQIYNEIWIDNSDDFSPEQWIVNDMLEYINNGNIYITDLEEEYYKILSRNPFLSSVTKMNSYIKKLYLKPGYNNEINIICGLMTIEDRIDFINYMQIIYWDKVDIINRNL